MNSVVATARSFRTAALDLLYPPGCSGCDEDVAAGQAFCPLCALTLVPLASACTRCALPNARTAVCGGCMRSPPPFNEAQAAYAFGGALADGLGLLKFSGRTNLAAPLGRQLAPLVALALARDRDSLVVPVPLSRRRLAARGYSPAALLALAAAPSARVSTSALIRVRDTPQQVGQSAAQRRAAMAGAFVASPQRVARRHIVLVDDVMTTGATLGACAEALFAAGAIHVLALTVARALP